MKLSTHIFLFLFLMGNFVYLAAQPTYFKVRVENVGEAFPFTQSGVFNTPVGAENPGPLFPGGIYEFSFDAAPGSYLSFATMFVQSNDLFYAPDEMGIALYDDMGNPVTGDLTSQLQLWDPGTEENEFPGEGMNQAPRQSGPDVGPADSDNTVRLVNDGYTYPANEEVIRFTLTHDGGTSFTAQIENVSTEATLTLSDGMTTVPVPLAPGVFVVHTAPAPLFTVGEPDRGEGLEGIAEDGNAAQMLATVQALTGVTAVLAPGVFAVHGDPNPLFTVGEMDRGEGLEAIAEDGNPAMLAALLQEAERMTGGAFAVPAGASGPAPALPGDAYEFVIASGPSGKLSFATMFVQSNDLFFAPDGMGIPLFNEDGTPVSGDVTDQVDLWDAGTEENEIPGIGVNQAPRQSGPDVGPADSDNTVRLVNDGYVYPANADVIKVTVMPLETTTFTVKVENVSDGNTLPIDANNSVAVPLSPGVWAIHSTPAPLFTIGSPDRGFGLEAIAEDGDPGPLDMSLAGKMGTPSGAFAIPSGGDMPAPAFPGDSYEFNITAAEGMYLSLATMFVQSNDLFFAPDEMGVALFDENGSPISGDITQYFDLWDAGTEGDEQPGVGMNQAPRQSGPNVGPMDENPNIRLAGDGFTYPADESVIKVTINPVIEPARLQVIHAANSQTVKVLVNGDELLPAFAYRTATPYIDVPAETPLTVELVPVGGPYTETYSFDIELASGQTYVAAAYGTFDPSDDQDIELGVLTPAVETAPGGYVGLSFFQGGTDISSLNVGANGSLLFSDVAYGTFADFTEFPAEDYQIHLVEGDNDFGMFSSSFSFWGGRSAVIFTSGATEDGSFHPWVALDNGGTFPLTKLEGLVPGNGVQGLAINENSNDFNTNTYKVFPNPTEQLTTLQYELKQASRLSIQLIDLNGRIIRTVFDGNVDAGFYQQQEDLSNLDKGVYFYSIQTDDEVRNVRIVLQ